MKFEYIMQYLFEVIFFTYFHPLNFNFKIKMNNCYSITSHFNWNPKMRAYDCFGGAERWVQNSIKKLDLFSKNIMFTYQKESKFSTFFGGCISLAILIIVGVYFVLLFKVMANKERSNNSVSTNIVDLSTNDQSYHPAWLKYIITHIHFNNV